MTIQISIASSGRWPVGPRARRHLRPKDPWTECRKSRPCPPPADGLETGEAGLTGPFARADANRDNMQAATECVEITRRQEGAAERSPRDEASADTTRPDDACLVPGPGVVPAQVPAQGVPTALGGVYNATGREAGGMTEEA